MCGEIFSNQLIANILLNPTVNVSGQLYSFTAQLI